MLPGKKSKPVEGDLSYFQPPKQSRETKISFFNVYAKVKLSLLNFSLKFTYHLLCFVN